VSDVDHRRALGIVFFVGVSALGVRRWELGVVDCVVSLGFSLGLVVNAFLCGLLEAHVPLGSIQSSFEIPHFFSAVETKGSLPEGP
jgi:hypothetical protein